jgi:hypothetical protein
MSTLDLVADALTRQDYESARQEIDKLLNIDPEQPLVMLYAAQLEEGTYNLDRALSIYQKLLKNTINPKILKPAREGVARIEARRKQAKQQAINLVKSEASENPELGILVLAPMAVADKQAAAQKLAKLMDIDAYSARLQLPTRGWKFYRQGNMGELSYYHEELNNIEIPNFCTSLAEIQQVCVFNVYHMYKFGPQVRIMCKDDRDREKEFLFEWAEITQVVTGLLPIFEEVVEINAQNRTLRKPKILDYIEICDLQIPSRRAIFRLCALTYDFSDRKEAERSGLLTRDATGDLVGNYRPDIPYTSRDNWQNLMEMVRENVGEVPTWNSFTPFAETALSHPEFLARINPYLELLRRADSDWDRAFQLYSSLALCQSPPSTEVDYADFN